MTHLGKQIGRRIRTLRTNGARRWTQEALAERAKISVSFLSMIERGERIAHLDTLAAIAGALNVCLRDLFDEVEREHERRPVDLMRPLVDFALARGLSEKDVERLLGVAHAMFSGPP